MENYVPSSYAGQHLSLQNWEKVILMISRNLSFTTVSVTGGEPSLRPDLLELMRILAKAFGPCELNTNGISLKDETLRALKPYVSRLKISLDSLIPKQFSALTGGKNEGSLDVVLRTIETARGLAIPTVINTVVSRRNISNIDSIIDYSISHGLRLHLLDYYYSEEKRLDWLSNFIPVDFLLKLLESRLPRLDEGERYGCEFFSFGYAGGGVVRLKRSSAATMRSQRCEKCERFCQEGIYGLKLSREGWLTTCPSTNMEDGVLLLPDWNDVEFLSNTAWVIREISSATQGDAFQTFLQKRKLTLESFDGND